jgi:uncharacterized protein
MLSAPDSIIRSPVPPFTADTARQKVRLADDAWNTRAPDRVVMVYTEDTRWRNRSEFLVGRTAVRGFLLRRKWDREIDYRLIKALWAHDGARIAVRFASSGTTTRASASTPTATRTGSSTRKA